MTTVNPDPTRIAPNPSDSILMTLARAAMASDVSAADVTWPSLDLTDSKQREFGDYELLEEIGRGGMGVVYRARQHSLDRDVAIKFIASGIADSFNVARFLGEARAAARLMHPNIVPVHEVGSIDGVYYFSMPLVKGHTLGSMLDDHPMAEVVILPLMLKLCDAIDYAHRLGLLHLDLKPANVLLDERGEPLITDFGLARHMDANGGVDTQEVSGTPSFMAPEQILIKQYRLTPATDLYALGAILYRALTGVSPHGVGPPDELIQRAIAGRVRSARDIVPGASADLAAVAMKCLELLPKDRYASVGQLADDLRRIRDGLPVSVREIGPWERYQRWFRRERKYALAFTALCVAILLGTTLSVSGWLVAANREQSANMQRYLADAARARAEAERSRAEGTSTLGAWLYARSERRGDANQSQAPELLRWLRDRFPGDERRQAAVLTGFTAALYKENPAAASALNLPLIQIMGRDYRQHVIAALAATDAPNRHALAARLAWYDEQFLSKPDRFLQLIDLAVKTQPDDADVWNIAATFCTGPEGAVRCHKPEAVDELVRVEPDNMYPWLLRAMSKVGSEAVVALREAAKRDRFDDHFRTVFSGYIEAIELGAVPVPRLIADPARILAPNVPPQRVIAWFESVSFPLVEWQPLINLCNPSKRALPSPSEYADCQTIGERMAASKGSALARHIGAIIVRRVARGTPLERQMIEMRRNYQFVMTMRDSLTDAQQLNYPSDRFQADVAREGEVEALVNEIAFYGLPTEAPAEWLPDDPNLLLLPEEREPHPRTPIK